MCLQSWNGSRCVCPLLTGGQQCSQGTVSPILETSLSFYRSSFCPILAAEQLTVSSGGYLQYSLQREEVRSAYTDQMELWFMTSGGGGVLFHMGSTWGEYATIAVRYMHLHFIMRRKDAQISKLSILSAPLAVFF